MAIAFDVATDGGAVTATSLTYSHTCTGSNLILWVAVGLAGAGDIVTGVTYNTVAMTQAVKNIDTANGSEIYLYYLTNPATGAHNVVVSLSASALIQSQSASYTGANQSGQPDATTTALTSGGTTLTETLTTVAPNCWMIAAAGVQRALTASTNSTKRSGGVSGNLAVFDSNGPIVSPGSFSMVQTVVSPPDAASAASFSPAGAAASPHLLGLLGVGV